MYVSLPSPSDEQDKIISTLIGNNNVIVEAVAGSGKTSTSLHIAKNFKDLKVLLLTYNSRLKKETRQKKQKLSLHNFSVHTFHSFGLKYYQSDCFTDNELIEIIEDNKNWILPINFDIIIIDEAQDINLIFYEFICKIIADNIKQAKICVLGDKNQSIYTYSGADSRYMSLANKLFNFNQYAWKRCYLSESFRVNKENVNFINEVFFQKEIMHSNLISKYKPQYIIADIFNYKNTKFYDRIKQEIFTWSRGGFQDIFILSYSIINKTPARNLSNWLSNNGIPVFVPFDDEEDINEKDIRNKVVFSTFHQAKGLEKRLVIVLGFDYSYFEYYNQDNHDENAPPNCLYVAITRSLNKLILVHHYAKPALPFLNKEKLLSEKFVFLISYFGKKAITREIKKQKDLGYDNNSIGVTKLLKHVPYDIVKKCIKNIEIMPQNQDVEIELENIKFKTYIKESNFYERISNITGIAIPIYYEWFCYKNNKKITVLKLLIDLLENQLDFVNNEYPDLIRFESFLRELYESTTFKIEDLLKLSTLWSYYNDKFNFKLNQISNENYNWIAEDDLNLIVSFIKKYISSSNCSYEKRIEISNEFELHSKNLNGFIDCIDYNKNIVWEFKCVDKVTNLHFLQLALYAYLFESKNITNDIIKKYEYYLINIKKSEIFKINFDFEQLKKIVDQLIVNKYFKKNFKNDNEFLQENIKIKNKYPSSKNKITVEQSIEKKLRIIKEHTKVNLSRSNNLINWNIDDKIIHPTFGEGYINKKMKNNFIEIIFKNSKRVLKSDHPLLQKVENYNAKK